MVARSIWLVDVDEVVAGGIDGELVGCDKRTFFVCGRCQAANASVEELDSASTRDWQTDDTGVVLRIDAHGEKVGPAERTEEGEDVVAVNARTSAKGANDHMLVAV